MDINVEPDGVVREVENRDVKDNQVTYRHCGVVKPSAYVALEAVVQELNTKEKAGAKTVTHQGIGK